MSMEEIKRFNEDVKSSSEMQEKVKAIGNDLEKVVNYANSHGYAFTLDDIQQLGQNNGLTDEDLDKVAGGGGVTAVAVLEVVEIIGVVAVASG